MDDNKNNNTDKFYFIKANVNIVAESIFESFVSFVSPYGEEYIKHEDYFNVLNYFNNMCEIRGDYWFFEKTNFESNNEHLFEEITEDEFNFPKFKNIDVGFLIDISEINKEGIESHLRFLEINYILKLNLNLAKYPILIKTYPEIFSLKEKEVISNELNTKNDIKSKKRL